MTILSFYENLSQLLHSYSRIYMNAVVLTLLVAGLIWLQPQLVSAQSIGINTDTPEPDAALDVRSSATQSQGLLLPRLTTMERDAIASPTESLLIFNTDTKCYQGYLSGAWVDIGCAPPPCITPSLTFSPAPPVEICTPTSSPNIESRSYAINTVPFATSYSWTLPTGWTITSGSGTESIDVDIDHTSTVGFSAVSVEVAVDDPACPGPTTYSLSHNFIQNKLPESIMPASSTITNCFPSTINMSAGPMAYPNTTYTWTNNFVNSELVGTAGSAVNLYDVDVTPPLTVSPREVALEVTNVCGTANLSSTINQAIPPVTPTFTLSPSVATLSGTPYVCNGPPNSPLTVSLSASMNAVPGSVIWVLNPGGAPDVVISTVGDNVVISAPTFGGPGSCSVTGSPIPQTTFTIQVEYVDATTGCVEDGMFQGFVCCGIATVCSCY